MEAATGGGGCWWGWVTGWNEKTNKKKTQICLEAGETGHVGTAGPEA